MPERPDGSHQVLVAVAHGSADPRAAATITDLMAVAAERAAARGLNLPEVRTAYLGHAAPSLPQVMSAIGHARVTVLPLLLTAAYHSKTDIPRVLARPGPRVPAAAGELRRHAGAAPAAAQRAGAPPGRGRSAGSRRADRRRAQTGVVLAAAGSTDQEANATVASLAAQWQARAGWFAVRAASAAAAAPLVPTPSEAVTGLLRAGARRVLVATYLLAPGLFRRPDPRIRPGRGRGGGSHPRSARCPRSPRSSWTGTKRRGRSGRRAA